MKLILGSASPRRRDLLASLDFDSIEKGCAILTIAS